MTGAIEWGIAEEIRQHTRLVNQNFNTWEEGDVHHFYDDLKTMFSSLRDDQSVLTRKQMGLVDAAWMSFDKMFHMRKSGHPADDPPHVYERVRSNEAKWSMGPFTRTVDNEDL